MPSWNHYLNVRSLFAASLFFLMTCSSSKKGGNASRNEKSIPITIPEGIAGSVVFKQGMFDASGKLSSEEGMLYGVERKIYVYAQTSIRAVDIAEGDFVNNVYEPLIDSLESNPDGFFEKKMKPGNYSLFILENSRLYSKVDENGYYFPVTVKTDSVSSIRLEIDYKAVY
ncbi:MAG TPA: hypothetical protein VK750_01830 [Cytophagaceae bacterium]|jgi:hypothetical protein|nr:hypothetical protein [Cytophagaceae bacterium]